jgi:hypothetical protein
LINDIPQDLLLRDVCFSAQRELPIFGNPRFLPDANADTLIALIV